MKRSGRVLVICRVALSALAALGVASLSASAAEFKATVSYRRPEKTESFPISVKGSKSRMDSTIEERQTVILVDQERGTVQALDVQERKYAEFPLVSSEAAFSLSLPMSIIGLAAAQPGNETQSLGTETVSGYGCDKFAIVSKDDPTFPLLTYWMSQKLQYPLKIAYGPNPRGEWVIEVTNIREGPVEDSLFQVPSGYTLAEITEPPPAGEQAVQGPATSTVTEPPGRLMPVEQWQILSAPVVRPPHKQRMSVGEIIRVKVEAGKKIVVSSHSEGNEGAVFTAAPFRGGKPIQDPQSKKYVTKLIAADPDVIMPDGFAQTPQEADEIVIRVDHGVVLIEVEQEAAD